MNTDTDPYRQLQKHLNRMAVGFPPTKSGVELSLLKRIFSPEEAVLATHLHYKPKPVDDIFSITKEIYGSKDELIASLDRIVSKGGILRRNRDGMLEYALLPFILWGMYEHQLKRLNQDFLNESGEYLMGEFGLELATSTLPKMRVVPVEESVKVNHNVATYDEMRQVIENAGERIAIQECFCRKVADMQDKHCKATQRREVCMSLGDLADLYVEEGWARRIDRKEAMEIVRKNEEEGLVLMPANEQEPNFICACCSDCCGMLSLMKNFPKPAEVVGSNYYAEVDPGLCKGCETCISRCPIDAVIKNNSVSSVDLKRCIGCGLCVPTCPENAMQLIAKKKEVKPPETVENHMDIIYKNRTSFSGRLRGKAIKSMIRVATKLSK